MNPVIVMLVFIPHHFWQDPPPVVIPGWTSMAECAAATDKAEKRLGVDQVLRKRAVWWNPFSETDVHEFIQAHATCEDMENGAGP